MPTDEDSPRPEERAASTDDVPTRATPPDDAPTIELPERLKARGTGTASPGDPPEIGPYRLIQRIGSGGMGEVWEAEQSEPIQRRVAIKLLRFGLQTRQILARFETERQALALMDHPTIAKVFDAGTAWDGRPYFVMELIQGAPISEYCDRRRLGTRERLELFRKVCDGVQHAHQKAIIHRDLKPSNVLVAEQGDQPEPKIIDFGIAKATAQRLSERTLFTELGQIVGTPEYMSPEQAVGGGEDVDTRSDVYSLGVLLYELLTGSLPFESKELREGGYDEIRRRIREDEPPRPSTRVSGLGETATAVANRRSTQSGQLVRRLRSDLDWITMKALEKDRRRRYGSPADLGADVDRHLDSLPVQAGPPSAAYRATKFVRRHRFGVAFAAVVGILLMALGVSTIVQSRQVAAERDRANLEAEAAREVTEFLVGLFEEVDPSRSRGNEVSAREVLDQGVQRIEDRFEDEPRTQATLLETMGRVYTALGLYGEARPLLERSVGLREPEAEAEPLALAKSLHDLGRLMHWQGDYVPGLEVARRAVELHEQTLGPEHADLATALNGLANFQEKNGLVDDAKETHLRTIAMRESVLGSEHPDLSQSFHNLAVLYLDNDLERAEELLLRSVELEEKGRGSESLELATSLHVLAIVYENLLRWDDAIEYEDRALGMRERVLGESHPHVSFSLTTLGNIYVAKGEPKLGEPHLRRALVIAEDSWTIAYGERRWTQRSLAKSLSEQGQVEEAEELLVELVAATEEGASEGALTPTLNALGALYYEVGRLEDAETALLRSLAIEERVSGADHLYVTESLVPLAEVAASSQPELARQRCARAIAIAENVERESTEARKVLERCAALERQIDG